MSQIQINNLNFIYPGQTEYIFKNVNLTLDTDWKLGLIGRNGSGKTTLLKLLLGEYESNNAISKNIEFEYFPYEIKNENDLTSNIAYKILPNLEEWRLYKELNLIKMDANILYRNFSTLSGGEMIKFLLICAFLKENKFLLIDEPTNHIDEESKDSLIEYLKQKKGFILVSHDRKILNEVVDHILYIGKQNITLEQGTYNSWKFNKTNRDNYEIEQNKRLKNDIMKLDEIAKKAENWSNAVEKSKKGAVDKGHVGHQAAKMMKRAKVLESRRDKKIEEKTGLLKDIDILPDLQMKPLIASRKNLILVQNLSIFYDKKILFKNLNFEINSGERVAIEGKNGSGKSSIVKLIVGENIPNNKGLKVMPNLKISYVSQMTDEVKGTISEYARYNNVDEGIFRAMLQKLGVDKEKLDKNLSDLSEGQKKKVMIARSISEDSEIFIWDEPLNYLDIQSREQIENMILKYEPTMLFIEHDNVFINKIATKVIQLPEE
jgi:lincosamide and streptogramin A transport system ATP-binding/permease protein